MSVNLKKILTITFLISFTFRVFAPSGESLVIIDTPPVEPFRQLIHAIGMVETRFDTLSYNPVEKAFGYFQIRPIRLNDYNRRTGSKYLMKDMFNYEISEKVFLYYASRIGPYNFERIARNWNGSGSKTHYYWKRVKSYL